MEIGKVISSNLVKYRKERGFTQQQLSEKIGYSNKIISNWEKGISTIDATVIYKICEVLEVSILDMYGISSVPKNDAPAGELAEETKLYLINQVANDPKLRAIFSDPEKVKLVKETTAYFIKNNIKVTLEGMKKILKD